VTLPRDHGLCELGGSTPADGVWRGMNHHSQFRCVTVVTTPQSNTTQVSPDVFLPTGTMVLNACTAGVTRTTAPGSAMYEPSISCEAHDPTVAVPAGTIGFAALKYQPYGTTSGYTTAEYQGGCINEDEEWGLSYLCPFPEFYMTVESDGFGQFSCYGAGSNYVWCEDDGSTIRNSLIWSPAATPNGTVWR
jgi:hypothetical protein